VVVMVTVCVKVPVKDVEPSWVMLCVLLLETITVGDCEGAKLMDCDNVGDRDCDGDAELTGESLYVPVSVLVLEGESLGVSEPVRCSVEELVFVD